MQRLTYLLLSWSQTTELGCWCDSLISTYPPLCKMELWPIFSHPYSFYHMQTHLGQTSTFRLFQWTSTSHSRSCTKVNWSKLVPSGHFFQVQGLVTQRTMSIINLCLLQLWAAQWSFKLPTFPFYSPKTGQTISYLLAKDRKTPKHF